MVMTQGAYMKAKGVRKGRQGIIACLKVSPRLH